MKTYFCSQHRDILDIEWKSKSCSIAALWMALRTLQENFTLTPDELLSEGLEIRAYLPSGFWKHASIAILAHNHGLPAYIEEFKSLPFGVESGYAGPLLDYGVEKIADFLEQEKGFVIVSIPKNFEEADKPHSVLFHGVKEVNGEKYFLYNDSEKISEQDGQDLEVSFVEFQEKWRRLAIFINHSII